MTARRTLVKRFRRKVSGGRLNVYCYSDGTMRIHYDHPSNDSEIEMAVGGYVLRKARETFAAAGYTLPDSVPMTWHDDPLQGSPE